jgi:DNA-binding IclR family transcriptional regulator
MQRTTDIAMKLDMNISTVSRHLNTMRDMGYLERDDATGLYFVGLKIIALAGASLQNNALFRHSYPELQQLSYKYDVHSHMGVPRETEIVHLISISCESTMELLIPMGHCHPMYCSAMGRAMLAYMPPDKAQEILVNSKIQRYTPQTKIDLGEITQELVRTRQKGYCTLIDELAECKGSIAATVFDRDRNPVAAVSVSASAYSLSQPQRERDLAKAVMNAASKISGKLGYYPK